MSQLESQEPQEEYLKVDNTLEHPGQGHLEESKDVTVVKDVGEFIWFGNEKFRRSELALAFGGTLMPGLAPPARYDLGNPAPLGLSGFALTTFVLSLINCGARGVNVPNIVVGLAYFYGGAAQLVAGMFEIASGNTFGGLALSSYAGFWGTWAAIYTNSFDITSAYTDKKEFGNAVGLVMIGWFIFTFFLVILTVKSTVAFMSLFALLDLTFLLLAITQFTGKNSVQIAAGVFGVLTAFAAWYNAYAGLANKENSYIRVKAINLPDLEEKFRH